MSNQCVTLTIQEAIFTRKCTVKWGKLSFKKVISNIRKHQKQGHKLFLVAVGLLVFRNV